MKLNRNETLNLELAYWERRRSEHRRRRYLKVANQVINVALGLALAWIIVGAAIEWRNYLRPSRMVIGTADAYGTGGPQEAR